jgi:hypothetical protein
VEITRRGMTWHFLWKVGRQTYRGQGTMRGGNLVVDWGQADPVIYRIQADGRLKGIWAGGKGTETLTPE